MLSTILQNPKVLFICLFITLIMTAMSTATLIIGYKVIIYKIITGMLHLKYVIVLGVLIGLGIVFAVLLFLYFTA